MVLGLAPEQGLEELVLFPLEDKNLLVLNLAGGGKHLHHRRERGRYPWLGTPQQIPRFQHHCGIPR